LDVDVTLFFKEIGDDYYRVSIRSRGNTSSQEVAKIFHGGGHDHAAGFFYKGKLANAKKDVLAVVKKQFEKTK
ncbi:MAG TPA: DHHA1 domain-containing protein, partial [Candidatus Deferrimicrobium sp.]|nr:DHHA1 domain-containing protein [Candidatus Deferrimicrobium sp.]